MTPRLVNTWHNVHTSFWFVPAVMVTAAAGLAFGAVELDRAYGDRLQRTGWLWGGSPDGAREVLSTIASSMITVAGVTFSVTVVALTMAASQFGPRLLRNFMRDTGNQVVLGTFVATFLYCLLVLRTVRSGTGDVFVPHFAATLALLLAVFAVGVLIYFIHHVSSSLQVETLVASISHELFGTIEHLFPEHLGEHLPEDSDRSVRLPPELERPGWKVAGDGPGYVEAVDNDGLMEIASREGLILRLLRRPGSFVSDELPVLEAWPVEREDDALARKLARMIAVGRHRTTTQDVEYPAQQVVAIALRALSPAINDPLTAMICVDWLGVGLLRLAGRRIPSVYRSDGGGRLRVIATTVDFARLADIMFNPIRRSARQHPAVLLRMLEKLHALALHARRQEDRRAIREHAGRVHAEAHDAGLGGTELEQIEEAFRRVKEGLAGDSRGENGRNARSDSA